MSKVPRCVYLSGPMTNLPQFNVPLFDAIAASLREQGWDVISPAELDSEEVRAAALASPDGKVGEGGLVANETWGDMLSRDVKLLADGVEIPEREDVRALRERLMREHNPQGDADGNPLVAHRGSQHVAIDAIALLPGWEKSRGARLEAFVGLLTGKQFYVTEGYNADTNGQWVDPADTLYRVSPRDAHWVEYMLASTWQGVMLYRPL